MTDIPLVIAAALEVNAFCQDQGWQYCFIGGLAVQRWGNPRYTQDVDLTLLTGFGNEQPFIESFLAHFPPRTPHSARFALESRVVLAQNSRGVGIDAALGAMPFEEATIRRASVWPIASGKSLRTCSAEDLITHKVFAGRPIDWSDVESVLTRHLGRLNLPQIRADLVPLLELKEDPESLPAFDHLIEKVRRRLG